VLADSTRLLTLTGAGGSGKTRLALVLATEMVDSFEDGVWWVELAPLSEPDLVPQAVASAVGNVNDPLVSGSFKPTDNDVSFEDAAFPFPANTLPTDGSALSVFDGTDPNGTWDLYVVDDNAFDSGQFAGGWSLDITTGSPEPQPDTTAPKVKSTTPQAGATGVSPTANLTSTFSEEMNASTINATTFKLFKKSSTTKVLASVGYDATADKATLEPTNSLKRGATYKAVVTTDAKDLAGNRLDQSSTLSGLQQKVWTFKVKN